MKKYLKIFVVCFALVALLTVSCFATSAQTTSTTPAYGHYVSPGDYVFNDFLDFSMLPLLESTIDFSFFSNGYFFDRISIFLNSNEVTVAFYYIGSPHVSDIFVGNYYDFSWSNSDYKTISFSDGFYIYDPNIYLWWQSNTTRVSPLYDSSLLDGFFSSFTFIGQWISGATSSLTTIFWSNNSLTFLGTLAVSALAFAVAFLIIGLISRFLKFRG